MTKGRHGEDRNGDKNRELELENHRLILEKSNLHAKLKEHQDGLNTLIQALKEEKEWAEEDLLISEENEKRLERENDELKTQIEELKKELKVKAGLWKERLEIRDEWLKIKDEKIKMLESREGLTSDKEFTEGGKIVCVYKFECDHCKHIIERESYPEFFLTLVAGVINSSDGLIPNFLTCPKCGRKDYEFLGVHL